MQRTKTAWEILEISPMATSEEVKKQYRKLARQYHPDVNKSPDAHTKMIQINQAYDAIQKGRGSTWTASTGQQETPKQAPPQQNYDWLWEFMQAMNSSFEYAQHQSPPKQEMAKEEKIKYCREHPNDISDEFLIGLLVGRRDAWSGFTVSDMVYDLKGEDLEFYVNGLTHKSTKIKANTLRWWKRGLPIKLAYRKAILDERLYGGR